MFGIDDRTSAEAKAHAREVLQAAGYEVDGGDSETVTDVDEHLTRVLAGYKAALQSVFDSVFFYYFYDY